MKRIVSATVIFVLGSVCAVSLASGSTGNGLPIRGRTPGAINPSVTQANIHQTICVAGYTERIRPSSYYTTSLKREQLASGYSFDGNTSTSAYEEDHLVPLEVGGNPTSALNLWPEPRHILWSATVKDRLENKIHSLVCSGTMSLRLGQEIFEKNWEQGYLKYIGNP